MAPGLYVYVDLAAERPNVLTVPAGAVFTEGGQSYCAAVADGKIDRKPVELGIRSGADVQIISGLKDSDQIVAKDAGGFRQGQAVEPTVTDVSATSAADKK